MLVVGVGVDTGARVGGGIASQLVVMRRLSGGVRVGHM